MRHHLIQDHLDACTAAATPADLERALHEAHAELSESEYRALQGKLLSAGNLAAERAEEFTLILTRLELISLNRALNLWLAELRQKKSYTDLMGEAAQSVAEATEIAQWLLERIDTIS